MERLVDVDSPWLVALFFGLASAVSLPLGALVGVWWKPPGRIVAMLLAFGGGALLAALALDLVAPGIDHGHHVPLIIGCVAGGLLFKLLDRAVSSGGGHLRKPATAAAFSVGQHDRALRKALRNLGRSGFADELDRKSRRLLLSIATVCTIPRDTWVYRAGDPADEVFILTAGAVDVMDGDTVIDQPAKNSQFGLLSFVTGLPRATDVRATSDTTAIAISRERLFDIAEYDPDLASWLSRIISDDGLAPYAEQFHGISNDKYTAWRSFAATELYDKGRYPALDGALARSGGQELVDILASEQGTGFFAGLPLATRQAFAERFIVKEHSAGEALFRAGDTADRFLILLHGTVHLVDNASPSLRPNIVPHGTAFGGMGFLTHGEHAVSAVAAGECNVAHLRRTDFDELVAADPYLRSYLADFLASDRTDTYLTAERSLEPSSAHGWMRKAAKATEASGVVPSLTSVTNVGAVNHAAAMAMFLGILLDGIPESFVIGANVLSSGALPASLLAGLFFANFPEALSSSVGMREQGLSRARILTMWTALMVITGAGAALGTFVLADASPSTFAIIEGIAAGAMLTMIAETMLPEAYHRGGGVVGLSTLAGFLVAIAL